MTWVSLRCAKAYISAVETLRGPDQRQMRFVFKLCALYINEKWSLYAENLVSGNLRYYSRFEALRCNGTRSVPATFKRSPSLPASTPSTPLTRLSTLAFSGFAGEVTAHFAFRYAGPGSHPEDQRNTYNECRDT